MDFLERNEKEKQFHLIKAMCNHSYSERIQSAMLLYLFLSSAKSKEISIEVAVVLLKRESAKEMSKENVDVLYDRREKKTKLNCFGKHKHTSMKLKCFMRKNLFVKLLSSCVCVRVRVSVEQQYGFYCNVFMI